MTASMTAEMSNESNLALRTSASFFEKYDRQESQELIASIAAHWLLSTDDFRLPIEPPLGLISNMHTFKEMYVMLLMPTDDGDGPLENGLDLREIHQIIRELTYAIYAFNQLPGIQLEANCDESSSCHLPPAYLDTRVGQTLIAVDYMLKGLWHGAYFPRDRRIKFSERWRSTLDVNQYGQAETKKPLLPEFINAGLIEIGEDADYKQTYASLPAELDSAEEKRFFLSHVEALSMRITMSQRRVYQYGALFAIDANWTVNSNVRLLDESRDTYERLNTRLQLHEIALRQALPAKPEIRRQLYLIKLISFLVPFLVCMKKRMRVPDINKLMPPLLTENLKTERELPPLILSSDFQCKNFTSTSTNHYFNIHGGIQIDFETPDPESPDAALSGSYNNIKEQMKKMMAQAQDPAALLHRDTYPVPVFDIGGKSYYGFPIAFETYYSQSPQKPRWVQAMTENITKLRPRLLPITDVHIHELFKKIFGIKKAMKCKNLANGLKAVSQRGQVAMLTTLCRRCPASRLAKADEMGLALMHHAAINDRPAIITALIAQSVDVNVKRLLLSDAYPPGTSGATPLHLAARCGSLTSVSCLLANCANAMATDQYGWAPIHNAAYYNQQHIVRLLVCRNLALLELQTKNELKSTPLLLACSSGALAAVKCLIELGAYIPRRDENKHTVVHLAALRFHTNVLDFLIQLNHPEVPVWKILVEMMKDDILINNDTAVKCLEVMTEANSQLWQSILDADGVSALVRLLQKKNNDDIQSTAASVLCNISSHTQVCEALTKAGAICTLIAMLPSQGQDVASRAAVVLADLASASADNQNEIGAGGGVQALVAMFNADLEDVLVNAVRAISVLCANHHGNQTAAMQCGGVEALVEFLSVDSMSLQASAAAAIASLTMDHRENQDAVINLGAAGPLVKQVRGHTVQVQVSAANALQALATNNAENQQIFLKLDAPSALMRLLKVWSMAVKEQGASSLWALAGDNHLQQKAIAIDIGIAQLTDMLLLASEKLQYIGCMAMTAMTLEDVEQQNMIAEQATIQPLVRLLRSPKTSQRVLLTVIRFLGTLCIGVAHKNNRLTQRKIAEEHTISILTGLLATPLTSELQVAVSITLACIVLGNPENQELLQETAFSFDLLLHLLKSEEKEIHMKAGMALAMFAFNNTAQQLAIQQAGGVSFHNFEIFLDGPDEFLRCYAAFQSVVLARVIMDKDHIEITAKGITTLVDVLQSKSDEAVILAAGRISSLSHTRAGLPDALVTLGAVPLLIDHLYSDNPELRRACAVALCYLSYHRPATRLLITACRQTPGLHAKLMANLGSTPKMCPHFIDEYDRCKVVGFPCLSLVVNGGPPAVPPPRPTSRPSTSQTMFAVSAHTRNRKGSSLRVGSAPATVCRSAPVDQSSNDIHHLPATPTKAAWKTRDRQERISRPTSRLISWKKSEKSSP